MPTELEFPGLGYLCTILCLNKLYLAGSLVIILYYTIFALRNALDLVSLCLNMFDGSIYYSGLSIIILFNVHFLEVTIATWVLQALGMFFWYAVREEVNGFVSVTPGVSE